MEVDGKNLKRVNDFIYLNSLIKSNSNQIKNVSEELELLRHRLNVWQISLLLQPSMCIQKSDSEVLS